MKELRIWFKKIQNTYVDEFQNFGDNYQAFVGFSKALVADNYGNTFLQNILGDTQARPLIDEVLFAIVKLAEGNTATPPPIHPDFIRSIPKLNEGVKILASFLAAPPPRLPGGQYGQSAQLAKKSIIFQRRLKNLQNTSTNLRCPYFEAIILYIFGNLLVGYNPSLFQPFFSDPHQVPFNFKILKEAAEGIINALDLQQDKQKQNAKGPRIKDQKFGILDAPNLLTNDLEVASGVHGGVCLYIDIDEFKIINSRFTERVVDKELLPSYQRLLLESTKNMGYVYAEGGDENTVFLPNATKEMGVALAEAFCQRLREHNFIINEEKLDLTVSIGIAHAETKDEIKQLPDFANKAMRESKRQGKNCIFIIHAGKPYRAQLVLRTD